MGWAIAAVMLWAVGAIDIGMTFLKNVGMPGILGGVTAILIGVLCWRTYLKRRKRRAIQIPKKMPEYTAPEPMRVEPLVHAGMLHLSGLPMSEGAWCDVDLYPDRLVFRREMQTITLPMSKIRDISTKGEREVRESYSSSAGGAVAGAMLFGVPGALVGGRTKKQTQVTQKIFLFIAYDRDNGEVVNLVFDITYGRRTGKLVSEYQKLPKLAREITL